MRPVLPRLPGARQNWSPSARVRSLVPKATGLVAPGVGWILASVAAIAGFCLSVFLIAAIPTLLVRLLRPHHFESIILCISFAYMWGCSAGMLLHDVWSLQELFWLRSWRFSNPSLQSDGCLEKNKQVVAS